MGNPLLSYPPTHKATVLGPGLNAWRVPYEAHMSVVEYASEGSACLREAASAKAAPTKHVEEPRLRLASRHGFQPVGASPLYPNEPSHLTIFVSLAPSMVAFAINPFWPKIRETMGSLICVVSMVAPAPRLSAATDPSAPAFQPALARNF